MLINPAIFSVTDVLLKGEQDSSPYQPDSSNILRLVATGNDSLTNLVSSGLI